MVALPWVVLAFDHKELGHRGTGRRVADISSKASGHLKLFSLLSVRPLEISLFAVALRFCSPDDHSNFDSPKQDPGLERRCTELSHEVSRESVFIVL